MFLRANALFSYVIERQRSWLAVNSLGSQHNIKNYFGKIFQQYIPATSFTSLYIRVPWMAVYVIAGLSQ